jgi:hypothetical protein
MTPYVQQWPRRIAMEEWLALAHPDVPALPWISDDGAEVCSLGVQPIKHIGGILVSLYDAHGREVLRTATPREHMAIEATAVALGATTDALTFLPVTVRPGRDRP